MKPHYFDQEKADEDDHYLKLAKKQGYVPENCLLDGSLVMVIINSGDDPCRECNAPREKCKGRKKGTCEEEEIPERFDESKIGMRDILGLMDLDREEVNLFVIDLVSNQCVFSRTLRGINFQDALPFLLDKNVTRIVVDCHEQIKKQVQDEIEKMVKLPYCAVELPEFKPIERKGYD